MKTRTARLGLAWLLLTSPALGSQLDSLEGTVREEHARRQQRLAERAVLAEQALSLAQAISRAKQTAGMPRADPDLERLLRDFEKLADRLDQLEAEVAEAKDRLARAAQRFEEAAEAAIESLRDDRLAPEEMAQGLTEIESARRRVAGWVEARTAFRPALEVVVEDSDGPEELKLKAEILRAEKDRLEREGRRLGAEDRLLAARVEAKLRIQRELEAAQRDARLDLRLVRTQAQRVRKAGEDLRRQRRNNEDQGRQLGLAVERIDERLAEIEGRLALLLHKPSTD